MATFNPPEMPIANAALIARKLKDNGYSQELIDAIADLGDETRNFAVKWDVLVAELG